MTRTACTIPQPFALCIQCNPEPSPYHAVWGGLFAAPKTRGVKNLSYSDGKRPHKFREINKMFNFLSGKYYFLRVK